MERYLSRLNHKGPIIEHFSMNEINVPQIEEIEDDINNIVREFISRSVLDTKLLAIG
jgi:hypothetical protein